MQQRQGCSNDIKIGFLAEFLPFLKNSYAIGNEIPGKYH